MKSLLKKTQIMSGMIAIAIILIALFSFYFPMKNRLEKSYVENFILLSKTQSNAIDQFIERSAEGARSLASRTVIREAIVDYLEERISIDELMTNTKSRYMDGIEALDYLLGAQRIVDGLYIVDHGQRVYDHETMLQGQIQITYDIGTIDNQLVLSIVSPIWQDDTILGYDVLFFDFYEQIASLHNDEIYISVVDRNTKQSHIGRGSIITTLQGDAIYHMDRIHAYIHIPSIDHYVHTEIEKNILFSTVESVMLYSALGFVAGVLLVFFIINWFIVRNASHIYHDMVCSRDDFKNKAFKDHLTDVYTRQFLDHWLKGKLQEEISHQSNHSIIMIDADHFKMVNDMYGHDVGDRVLKLIAQALEHSVRENDFVVRYGGDEFLLVLSNSKHVEGKAVMKRVEKYLEKNSQFPFEISITYGVVQVYDIKDFKDGIKQADDIMYQHKQRKQS